VPTAMDDKWMLRANSNQPRLIYRGMQCRFGRHKQLLLPQRQGVLIDCYHRFRMPRLRTPPSVLGHNTTSATIREKLLGRRLRRTRATYLPRRGTCEDSRFSTHFV